MGRWRKLMVAAAVTAGSGAALAAPVDAGEALAGWVDVDLEVRGPDAQAIHDDITFELFEEAGGTDVAGTTCGSATAATPTPLTAGSDFTCNGLGIGDYTVGLVGVPDGWTASAFCSAEPLQNERLVSGNPSFSVSPQTPFYSCSVRVWTPVVAIDKVVDGGDATVADFEFEIYDDTNAQVALPGTIVDPSADLCSAALSECVLVPLPAGEYTLGEVLPEYGYEVGSVECDSFIDLEDYFLAEDRPLEIIDAEGAQFRTDDGDAYCTVTNVHREGQLVVTASVNNDDGGTAGVEDVSIEVYEAAGSTPVVTATACAADGSCLDTMLPIGDYVIGYIGPDGYTREITQTVSLVLTEKVTDDADAAFTAQFGGIVEIEVAIDDPAAEPTTTTTQPATTTTAFGAGAGTLPPTGTSSETNTTIAVTAFALVAAGLALLGVRRRTV